MNTRMRRMEREARTVKPVVNIIIVRVANYKVREDWFGRACYRGVG